jgi:hypothetical protein
MFDSTGLSPYYCKEWTAAGYLSLVECKNIKFTLEKNSLIL